MNWEVSVSTLEEFLTVRNHFTADFFRRVEEDVRFHLKRLNLK
jgi:hypothetical protein